MIGLAALLMVGGVAPLSANSVATAELQRKIDEIVVRCHAATNIRARAMTPTSIGIHFADPPTKLAKNKDFSCVMNKAKALKGVTFAILGHEQYLDEQGHRR